MINIPRNCLLLAFIATFGLTACATQEQKLTDAGATRLDREQALAHIIGNTEVWTKGGGYYMPEGQMKSIWKGKETARTYSVSDEGEVCIKHERTFCHFYMNNDGAILMISEGTNAGVKKMLAGDHISSL